MKRAARLENLTRAHERISGTELRLRDDIARTRETAAAEASAHEKADRDLLRRLEDLSVGGLEFGLAGIAWGIIRNTLTTFPGGVAALLHSVLGQ
jgi:hypothetical protein